MESSVYCSSAFVIVVHEGVDVIYVLFVKGHFIVQVCGSAQLINNQKASRHRIAQGGGIW